MHVYLGNMVWRDCSARHADCLMRMYQLFAERGHTITNGTVIGDALVSRAQSIAATGFVESDAEVMLTIGSDIIFEPEDALRLVEKCAEGYDIIGAVIMKRAENPLPACIVPEEVVMASDSEPVETRYMGTGFTATTRRIFDALKPHMPLCHQNTPYPFYPFYLPMVVPDEREEFLYLSEDWALAQRAKTLGFHCWIDPTIRAGHLSTTILTMEDMLRPPKRNETVMRLRAMPGAKIAVDLPDGSI